MDRFKFRYVWSNGKNFIIEDFTLDEIEGGMPYDNFENEPFRKDYKLIDRLQSTGQKDKNNVLVYEEDIIMNFDSAGNKIIHIVKYDISRACFVALSGYNKDDDVSGGSRFDKDWIEKKEVIGNDKTERSLNEILHKL